jgi:hypothetical protein
MQLKAKNLYIEVPQHKERLGKTREFSKDYKVAQGAQKYRNNQTEGCM